VKAIHDHTKQQILVVCHTNYALDRFLEDLWKVGIPGTSMVRLGSRSDTQVAPLNLASQQKERTMRSKADWTVIDQLKRSSASYCSNLEDAMDQFMGSRISSKDILMYLSARPRWQLSRGRESSDARRLEQPSSHKTFMRQHRMSSSSRRLVKFLKAMFSL